MWWVIGVAVVLIGLGALSFFTRERRYTAYDPNRPESDLRLQRSADISLSHDIRDHGDDGGYRP